MNTLKLSLLIACISLFSVQTTVIAQQIADSNQVVKFTEGEVRKLLDKTDAETLKKADANEKKAKASEKTAIEKFKKAASIEQKGGFLKNFRVKNNKNTAITELTSASKLQSEVAKNRYDVYAKNLEKVRTEALADNKPLAQISEDKAASSYEESKKTRSEVSNLKGNPDEMKLAYTDASKKEEEALDQLLFAYGIYKTKTVIEIKKPKKVEPVVVEQRDTVKKIEKQQVTVIFSVQILALLSKPLSDAELKSRFGGDQIIWKSVEDGYHKYTVGRFNSYEEAKTYRDSLKINDAFVVAFVNGKKISVEEAIKTLNNNK